MSWLWQCLGSMLVCYADLVFSTCSICGVVYTLTKSGKVCRHHICSGGGQPPAPDPDPANLMSKLSVTEVRVCTCTWSPSRMCVCVSTHAPVHVEFFTVTRQLFPSVTCRYSMVESGRHKHCPQKGCCPDVNTKHPAKQDS